MYSYSVITSYVAAPHKQCNDLQQLCDAFVYVFQHTITSVLLLEEAYRHDSGLYECVNQVDITDKDSVNVDVNVDFHSYHISK